MSKTRPFGADRCSNCGKYGAHYLGPSFGDEGFFICKKKPCNKVLLIDATRYPLVRVIRFLSSKGVSGDEPLVFEEEFQTHMWEYYDYQPEDLEVKNNG